MKKSALALTFACAAAFSVSALAKVELTIPTNVKLLLVNGEKAPSVKGFGLKESSLTLPDGQNQLLLKYLPSFTHGSDKTTVESEAIIATFNASDDHLTFELPKYRNVNDAKKSIHQVMVKLNGQQAITVKQDYLIKQGFQFGRNYQYELEKYNQKGGVAAVNVAMPTGAATSTQPVDSTAKQGKATSAEEMLHFWYDKADEATKARFKAYINQ